MSYVVWIVALDVTKHDLALKSFRNKETQKLFMGRRSKAVSGRVARRALLKLAQLDKVGSVEELKVPPGNMLHKLGRDREGQWAISINDQYRVCFRFKDGDAYDVEAMDYHD